ncbi:MAG: hypothetical protein QXG08_03535 [Candidatus Methanomethyliaceae archaeon]
MGYYNAYGALKEAAGFDIMEMSIPSSKFKEGDVVSIYDIAGEKIIELQREREERERVRREIDDFVKAGGVVLYLNRCWECGGMQIIGGKWSGGEGRLPYDIYKRAKDVLTEATKKQWEHDSQGGNVCLASIGADIVFQELRKANFMAVVVSDDASQCCG